MKNLGGRRHWPIWSLILPLAAWALIRAFGLEGGSRFAPLLAFTPWAAIAALFAVGLAVALENWAAAIVAVLSLAILSAAVLPRAFGGGESVPLGARTLTVLSANIHAGSADPVALVDLVRRLSPDVLAIQELAPSSSRRLRRAGLGDLLPYSTIQLPVPGKPKLRPGLGTYSRFPLRRLAADEGSSTALELTPPQGARLRLVNFHPLRPVSDPAGWQAALEGLPSAGKGEPWLLAGDFNATLDQAALREVIARGYRDAGEVTGNGLQMTWPTGRGIPPLIAIDHVLADTRLGIAGYGVEDLEGSDHRAIWADVIMSSDKR